VKPPNGKDGFDWRHWVDRFDRMQRRYLPWRAERFEVMIGLIRATQGDPRRVLDLGCGAGSLSERVLDALPDCEVVGVDVDPAMLILARPRLERFGDRVRLIQADLRDGSALDDGGESFDAAVSATALHWLSPENLTGLYARLARRLRPGGVFLNADHVGSDCEAVQAAWEQGKRLRQDVPPDADTWDGFFTAYAEALGVDAGTMGERAVGPWEGVEDGMPLAWHLDRLRECEFVSVDCFWRCDGDAVYGGLGGRADRR